MGENKRQGTIPQTATEKAEEKEDLPDGNGAKDENQDETEDFDIPAFLRKIH